MIQVLNVVLPIFSLIGLGYLFRKLAIFEDSATKELNRFVVWLALPAQLFLFTASGNLAQIWQPGLVIAFSLSMLLVYFGVLLWRRMKTGNLSQASFEGLSAAYANTGYMGIPLTLLALGSEGLGAVIIATLIVVCGLFGVAIAFIEMGLQSHQPPKLIAWTVVKAILTNPLIVAPILGLVWALTGYELYKPFDQVLTMLGGAASPCALVSIGLFLAQERKQSSANCWYLVISKLFLQPLLAWFIAGPILGLSQFSVKAVVLVSALPTGTGPFMLAQYYKADGAQISKVVLMTTLLSVMTLSFIVWWIL